MSGEVNERLSDAGRLAVSREVLDGLSVGDALGEALSYRHRDVRTVADFSAFRDGTVRYTDDTEMALAVYEVLRLTRGMPEDALAWAFASRFRRDPDRGYGKMARRILTELAAGADWRDVSATAFGGGSFGNGAAMRVAPLGAWSASEPSRIPALAAASARVTHHHPEGIAGAVAVAAATGAAVRMRGRPVSEAVAIIWQDVLGFTPEGLVREGLERARRIPDASAREAARELGNGSGISAQDTVPFCIWNACRCLADYQEAILSTIEAGGDCDTNAAITGSIVSGFTGREGIPAEWLRVRESLRL